MNPSIIRGIAIAVAAAAAGCSGDTAPPPPATTMAAAPATTAPATTAPAASGTVAAGEFGVPACDDYMRKYMACVDSKVPESARAMTRQSLALSKKAWTQAASTPEGRVAVSAASVKAQESAKQTMAPYGCAW